MIAAAGARSPEARLRTVLGVNAAVTGVCALALTIFSRPFDDLLGTGHPGAVRIAGVALVLFALDVLLVSRARAALLVRGGYGIAAADVAWVVASVVTVAAGWYRGPGNVLVLGAAVVVAGLATMEVLALAAVGRAAAKLTATQTGSTRPAAIAE